MTSHSLDGDIHAPEIDWSTLPRPADDGAADHLQGMVLPDVPLPSTDGADVSLGVPAGRLVVFVYPMTAAPDEAPPHGWDEIPGARGCTSQACAFRDLSADLAAAGVDGIFGVSTQNTTLQMEAKERLALPYPLLSDHALALADALGLPRFEAGGETYLRRLTLIVEDGRVRDVHYPVFPPDADARWVLDQLGPSS